MLTRKELADARALADSVPDALIASRAGVGATAVEATAWVQPAEAQLARGTI